MKLRTPGCSLAAVIAATFIVFAGCAGFASLVNTEWTENLALASLGGQASHPGLNDGNLGTFGETALKADPRELTIELAESTRIRRIRITNENLYYFTISYWDARRGDWRTLKTVWQRRDIEGDGRVIQAMFDITRINIETDRIRLRVTRTVDDVIVSKLAPDPDDKVVNRIREIVGGTWIEYYRVWVEAPARVREVELYGILPTSR